MSPAHYLAVLMIAGVLTVPLHGQGRPTFPKPPEPSNRSVRVNGPSGDPGLQDRQRTAEVQKNAIEQDTDKLLKLVTELKQHLKQSAPGTFSVGALRKSEEIEKLAKRVRKELAGH